MRVKEEAAFEIDEAGARGRVLYLLPSLSESIPPPLRGSPIIRIRPNDRRPTIQGFSSFSIGQTRRALSLSLGGDGGATMKGKWLVKKWRSGKKQRTESTTKIIAERNEEESDGADGGEEEGRSVGWYGGCSPASSTSHSPVGGSDDRDRRQKEG